MHIRSCGQDLTSSNVLFLSRKCLLIRHLHTFIIEVFLGHDLQTSFYFMKSHQNQNAFLRKEILYSTLVNCRLQSGVVTFKLEEKKSQDVMQTLLCVSAKMSTYYTDMIVIEENVEANWRLT